MIMMVMHFIPMQCMRQWDDKTTQKEREKKETDYKSEKYYIT